MFNYSSSIEGGALSAFGVDYNFEGKKFDKKESLNKLGFSLDSLVFSDYSLQKPNNIKIDVDGIEHLILEGAKKTLKLECCRSVLIEINDSFIEQSEKSKNILLECGYKIQDKKHSMFTKNNLGFEKTYNQIWTKI